MPHLSNPITSNSIKSVVSISLKLEKLQFQSLTLQQLSYLKCSLAFTATNNLALA